MVENSPSFCLGLVFSASSPLMVTLTMCVVLFDKPGSKQRAADKQTGSFFKSRGQAPCHFTKTSPACSYTQSRVKF